MALFPPTFLPIDPPAVHERNVPHWIEEGQVLLKDVARRLNLAAALRERRLTPEHGRSLLHGLVANVKPVVSSLTDALTRGAVRLGGWFRSFRDAIVPGFFAGGMAITNNPDPSPADLAAIANASNAQVKYLARFRDQIADATVLLDGTARARAEMYADALWGTSEDVLRARMIREGFREARSILGHSDHCGSCLYEATRGWVPIGAAVLPGRRTCVSRCKCHLEFRA